MFHSAEFRLAASGQISYRQAIRRLFDVREAVATAQPYSASIMGHAESFQFKHGVLCYKDGDVIRILNVHQADEIEHVINVKAAFFEHVLRQSCPVNTHALHITLLHYSDGLASCLCEWVGEKWLVAFDTGGHSSKGSSNRVRIVRRLRSARELFVRNNASFLYYGTHSRIVYHGQHDHYEWLIHGVDLLEDRNLTGQPIQLENVVGSEIGSTVCFEIRDNYLYAVSNQTSHEEEEIDWTSFYVCVRIPLAKPTEPMWQRYWRRQHQEGPLNDIWTTLALQTDEETGNLMIVESRREWRDGGSENYRTYYMQPIDCPNAQTEWDAESLDPVTMHSHSSELDPPSSGFPRYRPPPVNELPSDDPLIRTLDAFSKPNYAPPRKRIRRQYHQEYTETERNSVLRRDFPLSKTKFSTYNHSASSFIDLVNDPLSSHSFPAPPDRLRLRIGSRKRKCPIDEAGEEVRAGFLYQPEHRYKDGSAMECSEERFTSRGISLWPPDDAPEALFWSMCPRSASGSMEATADERAVMYLTKSTDDARQILVLINFDPTIRLRGLKRLEEPCLSKSTGNKRQRCEKGVGSGIVTPDVQLTVPHFSPLSNARSYSTSSTPYSNGNPSTCADSITPGLDHAEPRWFTIEPASYRSMDGYWLR